MLRYLGDETELVAVDVRAVTRVDEFARSTHAELAVDCRWGNTVQLDEGLLHLLMI